MEQTNYTKTVLVVIALLVILGLVYYFFISPRPTQAPDYVTPTQQTATEVEPGEVSLIGEYTCLPLKVAAASTSPATPCVLGLKTDDTTYYGLDLSATTMPAGKFKEGDAVVVEGNRVSANQAAYATWSQYKLYAVIQVKSMFVPEK